MKDSLTLGDVTGGRSLLRLELLLREVFPGGSYAEGQDRPEVKPGQALQEDCLKKVYCDLG